MAENPNIHPAEKGFNRTWETIKHVGGKALKWAAYGALAFGALFLITGGAILTPIAALVGFFSPGAAASLVGSALVAPLVVGGTVGAIFGALKGVGSAGEAVEEKWQDRMADYENNEVRIQRNQMLSAQRGAAAGAGGSVMSNLFGGPSPEQGRGR